MAISRIKVLCYTDHLLPGNSLREQDLKKNLISVNRVVCLKKEKNFIRKHENCDKNFNFHPTGCNCKFGQIYQNNLKYDPFKIQNSKNVSTEKEKEKENETSMGIEIALKFLKFYKREISPLLPGSCRYVPTCSEYAMAAFKNYGVMKGFVLTTLRILRCNPFGGSGFDPPRWFDEPRPPPY